MGSGGASIKLGGWAHSLVRGREPRLEDWVSSRKSCEGKRDKKRYTIWCNELEDLRDTPVPSIRPLGATPRPTPRPTPLVCDRFGGCYLYDIKAGKTTWRGDDPYR